MLSHTSTQHSKQNNCVTIEKAGEGVQHTSRSQLHITLPNKFRSTWMQLNKESRNQMGAAVHKVFTINSERLFNWPTSG